MKKLFVLGALLMAALPSVACDQCGCGLLLGVQPHDNTNNFGLQWRMRYLNGDIMSPASTSSNVLKHAGHSGAPITDVASNYTEVYTVLEARGQVWLGKRASLTASIPFVNNFQSVDGVRYADIYAVGDPMLLARYAVLASTSGPDTTRLRHRFTVGLGVKLPLGRTNVQQFGRELAHDLQPGTGTWDGMLSLEYSVRGGSWGTSMGLMGRYNGEMEGGYRMGHSASFTGEVFRIIPIKSVKLVPSMGAYIEAAMQDEMDSVADPTTGDRTLFSHVGARMWWRNIGVSFAWQHALMRDIGSLMVPNREKFTAGIMYSFERD